MKRFSLLTAAALLASTPLFAMDGGGVSISGEANFGVKFKENDGGANAPNELQFHHEFDIKFSASGTTDGGIGFGGSVSIDNRESVAVGTKAGTPATIATRLDVQNAVLDTLNTAATSGTDAVAETTGVDAFRFTAGSASKGDFYVELNDDGDKIVDVHLGIAPGKNRYKVSVKTTDNLIILDKTGSPVAVQEGGGTNGSGWVHHDGDGTVGGADDAVYLVRPGVGPMTKATAASFDPDASNNIDNHGEVYISMDMHKLTIGSDLDAADKLAGGLADPGFDGIGIDDEAERVWGKSAADVRYDGDFGVASVAISYGDNAGDAEWAAGFKFSVDPVTFGAGFDSNGVMSLGMGFTQGQIAMNALYSTDSDHDEADNEAVPAVAADENQAASGTVTNPLIKSNKPDLKNQAMGVDVTYQMTESTSLALVAAQHKIENVVNYYKATTNGSTLDGTNVLATSSTAGSIEKVWRPKTSTTVDAFGVGFSHDLGGGATLKAGAGSVDSNAVADLGITMKF